MQQKFRNGDCPAEEVEGTCQQRTHHQRHHQKKSYRNHHPDTPGSRSDPTPNAALVVSFSTPNATERISDFPEDTGRAEQGDDAADNTRKHPFTGSVWG